MLRALTSEDKGLSVPMLPACLSVVTVSRNTAPRA
jgi:hypothetical protein